MAMDSGEVGCLARACNGEQPMGSVGFGPGWPGGGVGVVFSTPPLMIMQGKRLLPSGRGLFYGLVCL